MERLLPASPMSLLAPQPPGSLGEWRALDCHSPTSTGSAHTHSSGARTVPSLTNLSYGMFATVHAGGKLVSALIGFCITCWQTPGD